MNLRRLIPVLFIKNGLIVRSEGFQYHQILGNIINEAARYNEWNVDELVYIDISREKRYDARRDDHYVKSFTTLEEIIQAISRVCFMPLTFGGGIRTLEDIDLRIRSGADKIVLNTGGFENPRLITEASKKYGRQCIMMSVDYKVINGTPLLHTRFGETNSGVSIFDWIQECEKLGAGEIFLHAIDRDGVGKGYDLEMIARVAEQTRLPVIACGGAGMLEDFIDVFQQTGVSAVAAGNIFHFTERSYPRAKKMLLREKINVRK